MNDPIIVDVALEKTGIGYSAFQIKIKCTDALSPVYQLPVRHGGTVEEFLAQLQRMQDWLQQAVTSAQHDS